MSCGAGNEKIGYNISRECVRSSSCHVAALKWLGFALDQRPVEEFRGAEKKEALCDAWPTTNHFPSRLDALYTGQLRAEFLTSPYG